MKSSEVGEANILPGATSTYDQNAHRDPSLGGAQLLHAAASVSPSATNRPNGNTSTSNTTSSNPTKGVVVVYKECLKNHAAALGGSATDGCGEFMPAGEGGSLDALRCSACGCHRNFHRKEVDDSGAPYLPQCPYWSRGTSSISPPMPRDDQMPQCHQSKGVLRVRGGPHFSAIAHGGTGVEPTTTPLGSQKLENGGEGSRREVVQEGGQQRVEGVNKKRFRTKFTAEQKEKMVGFAEKAGWKIQKLDERLVQQFCQELGIKRRVLKVWMHNNKHHFLKTNINSPATNDNNSYSNCSDS